MNLLDLTHRTPPQPWTEGDTIPWNDPDFSRRMLKEHLSQEHDAASRRFTVIDRHVRFIHEQVLGSVPSHILDLGCGPGLYSHRLAALGHRVRGIDFSPASIAYARETAQAGRLDCTYTLSDVRVAEFEPTAYDLVMFIYGEFNVFRPEDARNILRKANAALKPGGKLLLEPSTEADIRKIGAEAPSWYTSQSGLFSDRPHLLLKESFWHPDQRATTTRYFLVDAATAQVERFAGSYQAYSQDDMQALLESHGFCDVRFYASLTGDPEPGNFYVVTAVRG